MRLGEIPNRDKLIEFIINDAMFSGDMVEVGTDLGAYFSQFLTIKNSIPKRRNYGRLFLVDTWDVRHFYKDIEEWEMWNRFTTVLAATLQARDVYAIRGESLPVSRAFPDNSLDFVYIDAQHHFEAVRDDINAWYPKVRHGGIIAGHDHHMPGVSLAVKETLGDVYVTWEEEAGTWYKMR
jgi:hypothetical protein